MEGLKASLLLFEAKHFVFAFLAHALGALFGIANAFMLPSPLWFNAIHMLGSDLYIGVRSKT